MTTRRRVRARPVSAVGYASLPISTAGIRVLAVTSKRFRSGHACTLRFGSAVPGSTVTVELWGVAGSQKYLHKSVQIVGFTADAYQALTFTGAGAEAWEVWLSASNITAPVSVVAILTAYGKEP